MLFNFPQKINLLQRFAFGADPFVIFESLTVTERKEIEGFFVADHQQNFERFFLRSKSLNLLTAIFSKIVNRFAIHNPHAGQYQEQMAEIEEHLISNIYNGLPDLKSLARKIAVSESTLKRYFARIYGKNIYNYFLEKRMNCAKVLLTEKKKSVTETAYIMGYENVSHFSSTFKKFFGLLPGVLLKEGVVTEE
jgi:AraC-like DNA-binding protein